MSAFYSCVFHLYLLEITQENNGRFFFFSQFTRISSAEDLFTLWCLSPQLVGNSSIPCSLTLLQRSLSNKALKPDQYIIQTLCLHASLQKKGTWHSDSNGDCHTSLSFTLNISQLIWALLFSRLPVVDPCFSLFYLYFHAHSKCSAFMKPRWMKDDRRV